KIWTSTVYTFYKGDIKVIIKKGQKHHEFTCAACGCNHKILQNLKPKNCNSTKALLSHAKKCWGEETVMAASNTKNLGQAKEILYHFDHFVGHRSQGPPTKRNVTACPTSHWSVMIFFRFLRAPSGRLT
ncbi:hypothetical protein BT96DRAFT_840326, partial [Gymnopus androsaceus JB14]